MDYVRTTQASPYSWWHGDADHGCAWRMASDTSPGQQLHHFRKWPMYARRDGNVGLARSTVCVEEHSRCRQASHEPVSGLFAQSVPPHPSSEVLGGPTRTPCG
ncbi:MAG: hypothetical protein WC734_04555 [Patescibacteria group bacterium]